jgi:hypothetical protein
MQDPARDLLRIPLLGTGVRIAFTTAHFHSFGVALAGPWNTWVNDERKHAKRGCI